MLIINRKLWIKDKRTSKSIIWIAILPLNTQTQGKLEFVLYKMYNCSIIEVNGRYRERRYRDTTIDAIQNHIILNTMKTFFRNMFSLYWINEVKDIHFIHAYKDSMLWME